MRRQIARLLLAATTMLVAMLLVTGAALAADGSESEHADETTTQSEHSDEGEHADEGEHGDDAKKATGFGTSKFDALIVAALAGIVMGSVAYGMSNPGDIERVSDHH